MSPRKRMSRARAERSERIIRYASLALILIVIGAFAWQMMPKQDSACGYFDTIAAAEKYDAPPPISIDLDKKYTATIRLEKGGEIQIELYPDKAPVTVNNFIFLACKGFYDGVTFHRVLAGFMAQAGDPTGSGTGGPGYRFDNEDSDLVFDKEGVVAMANAGRDTNGSQFFITFGPVENLNGGYTIFGQVASGMDVAASITLRDPQQNPDFEGDKIRDISVLEQ